jgi:hypothetical protein
MGDEFNAGKYGAIVAIPFFAANIVTNKSAEDLAMGGTNTLAVMPKAGSVVGISARLSAAITAGTLAFRAHKDGTEFAQSGYPNPSLSSTAGVSQESYASVRPGVLVFSADEGVGISYASSTDMAPTNTNDVDALLFVQLDPN